MSDFGELDEELLALAGGESDNEQETTTKADEDTGKRSRSASRSRSRSQTPQQPAAREPSKSPPRRGVAQKRKAKKGAAKRSAVESDEEEGEASDAPGSPDSAGSAAMEESDSDTAGPSSPAPDNDVLFPVEGKFKSERDRAEIMGMSEIQRESILAERAAQVERETQNRHLRRIAQQQTTSQAVSEKKRKAAAADLEDEGRKGSRVRKNEQLESYKRQREERNNQKRRDEARRANGRRDDSPRGRESDRDADGESEPEYDERPPAREEPASYRDYDLVRIGRSNFTKVCFYPDFIDAVTGCFVRVSIGQDKGTGQNVYRMAQIKGITEGKPYAMEFTPSPYHKSIITTDRYAILAHGKAEKEWPFLACSDSKITDSEFTKWQRTMDADGLRMPSKRFLADKLNDIHKLLSTVWDDDSLAKKFAVQNKYKNFDGPIIGLSALQEKMAPSKPVQSDKNTQAERLAELNRRNRRANIEEIRRAEIMEKKAQAAARAKAREEAEQKKREAQEKQTLRVDALFEGGSDISRTATPVGGVGAEKKLSERKKREINGIPTFKKKTLDDDILGSMDLGIDIEI